MTPLKKFHIRNIAKHIFHSTHLRRITGATGMASVGYLMVDNPDIQMGFASLAISLVVLMWFHVWAIIIQTRNELNYTISYINHYALPYWGHTSSVYLPLVVEEWLDSEGL